MIQPLMSNNYSTSRMANGKVSFGSNVENKQPETTAAVEDAKVEKESLFVRLKKGYANIAKTFNNVTNITSGTVKGVVEGAAVASAIAVVGKNATEGFTFKTIGRSIADIAKAGGMVVKHIPDAILKSPVENIKTLFSSSTKAISAISKGARQHKSLAAIAAIAGGVVAAVKIVQGKVKANKANADIDHSLRFKH